MALSAVLAAAAVRAFAHPTDILPAGDLAPGMKGYGFSDLGDGKGVQRFEVEIVGLLKSYAPKQDLILARVLGNLLDKTGIIAGMRLGACQNSIAAKTFARCRTMPRRWIRLSNPAR